MIIVENKIDEQNKEVWSFNEFGFKIVFIGYTHQNKQPKKRSWTIVDKWDKYMNRDCTIKEPFLNDYIKRLALEECQKQIKVMTWEEYKS